jgi:hypothetical protein
MGYVCSQRQSALLWIDSVHFTVVLIDGGQHGALERYEFRTRYRTGVERAATPEPTADA